MKFYEIWKKTKIGNYGKCVNVLKYKVIKKMWKIYEEIKSWWIDKNFDENGGISEILEKREKKCKEKCFDVISKIVMKCEKW